MNIKTKTTDYEAPSVICREVSAEGGFAKSGTYSGTPASGDYEHFDLGTI